EAELGPDTVWSTILGRDPQRLVRCRLPQPGPGHRQYGFHVVPLLPALNGSHATTGRHFDRANRCLSAGFSSFFRSVLQRAFALIRPCAECFILMFRWLPSGGF